MAGLVNIYLKTLHRYPIRTQALTAGSMMAMGDAISQFAVERKSFTQYQAERGIRFFLFGTFIGGPTLCYWYRFLDRICKGTPAVATVKKIIVDQTIMAPAFLTVFLGVMEAWKTRSFEAVKNKYKTDFVPILITNYKVWPAAQLINFYFIPLHHRVLFVQIIAIAWNTYLSFASENSSLDMTS